MANSFWYSVSPDDAQTVLQWRQDHGHYIPRSIDGRNIRGFLRASTGTPKQRIRANRTCDLQWGPPSAYRDEYERNADELVTLLSDRGASRACQRFARHASFADPLPSPMLQGRTMAMIYEMQYDSILTYRRKTRGQRRSALWRAGSCANSVPRNPPRAARVDVKRTEVPRAGDASLSSAPCQPVEQPKFGSGYTLPSPQYAQHCTKDYPEKLWRSTSHAHAHQGPDETPHVVRGRRSRRCTSRHQRRCRLQPSVSPHQKSAYVPSPPPECSFPAGSASLPFFVAGSQVTQMPSHREPAPGSRIRPVGPERLDYGVLDALERSFPPPQNEPSWVETSSIIRDPAVFLAHWTATPSMCVPGPISHMEPQHIDDVADMGIFSSRPGSHSAPAIVNRAFPIYKDEQDARLILHPKAANDLMHRPPKVRLAGRDDIHGAVLRFSLAAEDDGSNWFYRFETHPFLHAFFAARLPILGIIYLTTLCMGWTWSMLIAHTASQVLARATTARCSPGTVGVIPYADNFLLGATTRKAGRRLLAAWFWVTRAANAPMKGKDLRMRSRLHWLGLALDLRVKTIGVPKATLDTLRARLTHMLTQPVSHHFMWQTFGAVSYYLYALRLPLWDYAHLMLWFRRRARLLAANPGLWHSRARIWPSAVQDLQRAILALQSPQKATEPPADSREGDIVLFTDASAWGGGAVILGHTRRQHSYPWSADQQRLPVHCLEALALLEGLRLVASDTQRGMLIQVFVDNTAVVFSWAKGNSKDPRLSSILATTHRLVRDLGVTVRVTWIPTLYQLADKPSRGHTLESSELQQMPTKRASDQDVPHSAARQIRRGTRRPNPTPIYLHRRTGRSFVSKHVRDLQAYQRLVPDDTLDL